MNWCPAALVLEGNHAGLEFPSFFYLKMLIPVNLDGSSTSSAWSIVELQGDLESKEGGSRPIDGCDVGQLGFKNVSISIPSHFMITESLTFFFNFVGETNAYDWAAYLGGESRTDVIAISGLKA